MAVCRWIYANAKLENDRKDYFVRLCDSKLEACKRTLIELSNRLISADKRRGKAEQQICWFAGYISREIYFVAVGGRQEELLGISSGKFREQHCVLGYGFTGNDICLLIKDDKMFEPLKEIMREIQRSGEEKKIDAAEIKKMDFSAYRMESPAFLPDSGRTRDAGTFLSDSRRKMQKQDGCFIYQSTEETDRKLWKHSLNQPVMTGIISMEDGKRLLGSFPYGIVTVIENAAQRIYVPGEENECAGLYEQKLETGWKDKNKQQCEQGGQKDQQKQKDRQSAEERQKQKYEQGLEDQQKRKFGHDLEGQQKQYCGQGMKVQQEQYREQGLREQQKYERGRKMQQKPEQVQSLKERERKEQEQRQQELRRQKQREKMRLIKYWALWCRKHLSQAQVEAVINTIEAMKEGAKWNGKGNAFFRQCEYAAYMLLWHDKRKRKKEQEIHFLIESWADTMNVKKTVQLAELIEHLNSVQGGSAGR